MPRGAVIERGCDSAQEFGNVVLLLPLAVCEIDPVHDHPRTPVRGGNRVHRIDRLGEFPASLYVAAGGIVCGGA